MTREEQILIVGRFFEVISDLKSSRRIRGLKTFTDRYGIHRTQVRRLQEDPSRDFKAAWLTYLVVDYGVSAQWLLTGEGSMYGKR